MNGILIPNDNFDFTKIHLSDPVPLPHERVFAKILYGDTDNNLLLYRRYFKLGLEIIHLV